MKSKQRTEYASTTDKTPLPVEVVMTCYKIGYTRHHIPFVSGGFSLELEHKLDHLSPLLLKVLHKNLSLCPNVSTHILLLSKISGTFFYIV